MLYGARGYPKQSFFCGVQGSFPFAKAETDKTGSARRFMEETAARNNGNADFLHEIAGEISVAERTERAEVGHNVICALGD